MKLMYGVKRSGIPESDESQKGDESEEEDCLNQRQSSSAPLLGKKHKHKDAATCKSVFSNYVSCSLILGFYLHYAYYRKLVLCNHRYSILGQ